MTYSLGSATKPNATWGAFYNDMGLVQDERPSLSADLSVEGLIGLGRDETLVDDVGGAILRITISFKKIVDSSAEATTFLQALLALIDGNQIPPNYPLSYTSDRLGTINVKVEHIDPMIAVTDGPCVIYYTLKLIQCSSMW